MVFYNITNYIEISTYNFGLLHFALTPHDTSEDIEGNLTRTGNASISIAKLKDVITNSR